MSSYSGQQTASEQRDMRQSAKAKQAQGKGAVKNSNTLVYDKKEHYTPRVMTGAFTGETEAAIQQHFKDHPETPITQSFFYGLLNIGKTLKVKVNMPGIVGTAEISKEKGITGLGIQPTVLHVFTAGGFGITFKINRGEFFID